MARKLILLSCAALMLGASRLVIGIGGQAPLPDTPRAGALHARGSVTHPAARFDEEASPSAKPRVSLGLPASSDPHTARGATDKSREQAF